MVVALINHLKGDNDRDLQWNLLYDKYATSIHVLDDCRAKISAMTE